MTGKPRRTFGSSLSFWLSFFAGSCALLWLSSHTVLLIFAGAFLGGSFLVSAFREVTRPYATWTDAFKWSNPKKEALEAAKGTEALRASAMARLNELPRGRGCPMLSPRTKPRIRATSKPAWLRRPQVRFPYEPIA